MERRFSERRRLFLEIYDRGDPRPSLLRYMKAAQENEGYRYRHEADSGPVSLFLGGSVPKGTSGKGELPECQLLGFVDGNRRVGCMAHPLAETSRGYDGRDHAGFFSHTGCCESVGCEASYEFRHLSPPARKVFGRAVRGMSWYEYSRHATSVLVYYLRSYDFILQRLDEKRLLDAWTLKELAGCTNDLYDEWPLRQPGRSKPRPPGAGGVPESACMSSLDILMTDIPLGERMLFIALGARFSRENFAGQLHQARSFVERSIEALG